MTNFTIKVSLDVEAPYTFHQERSRTVEIPPDYQLEDRRRLYAIRLESLADDIFEDLGWFQPLRHALLANDSRALEIERLVNDDVSALADAIRDVLNTPSEEAILLWGSPAIEVDEPDLG
jgi:hypothetical protein